MADTNKHTMRRYPGGGIRDTSDGKPQYEGCLSPVVLRRFAEYMLAHTTQADGETRSADNWQRGMDRDDYMDSLVRHVIEAWLVHRGNPGVDIEESLCAVLFNAQGYLFEKMVDEQRAARPARA